MGGRCESVGGFVVCVVLVACVCVRECVKAWSVVCREEVLRLCVCVCVCVGCRECPGRERRAGRLGCEPAGALLGG